MRSPPSAKPAHGAAFHWTLFELTPPAYDRLVLVTERKRPSEGAIVCVDGRQLAWEKLHLLYQTLPDMLTMFRYHSLALLCSPATDSLLRVANSRPLHHGFRAVIADGQDWHTVLRLALTEESRPSLPTLSETV
jgi:hypothetical protein